MMVKVLLKREGPRKKEREREREDERVVSQNPLRVAMLF
jgi:hypothetical protein